MLTTEKANEVLQAMLKTFYQSLGEERVNTTDALMLLSMFNIQVLAKMAEQLLINDFKSENVSFGVIFSELKQMFIEHIQGAELMDSRDEMH